ncbi:hypothetical protein J2T03_003540 [Chryseobacterium lathyri]|nr:hypothetical protein [Chryseobacterium lathyri]
MATKSRIRYESPSIKAVLRYMMII